jgi:2,4-dienoyl-CoA reductase-like NADH-dependent reductase (Old Yellow Enzyme family)
VTTPAVPRPFPHLFSPFWLGKYRLRNRMVMPGITTNFAEADGHVGDRLCDYLQARARGEFGLIIVENIGVHASGRVMPRMVMGHEDRYLPGLARLADAIKSQGACAIAQISHAGRQTKSKITGQPLVFPSPIPCPINREMPDVLTVDGIRVMEDAFVKAAARLDRAGFNGVEIHAAHGYLMAAFLSRYSNKRDDLYGGSLDNRMRFLRNVIDGIKTAVSRDFLVLVRISAKEFVPQGIDVAEAIEIGRMLEPQGVAALSVSVGVYESFNKLSMVSGEPEGQWLHVAEAVRRGIGLPVIGVGRIKRGEVAEAALARGQIDLAAFGRAAVADPDLPRKLRLASREPIIWCIGCNICLGRTARPETICPVNPAVGREAEFDFRRASEPQRIIIVGSSMSALTAAWIAASCGHAVTVEEPGQQLGGMQAWRARVPGQEEYWEAIASLAERARQAGAEIRIGATVGNRAAIRWAIRRFEPAFREARSPPHATTSYDILSGRCTIAKGRPVTVHGDDLSAAEAAIVLAHAGHRVTLYSPAAEIATDAHPGYRDVSRRVLAAAGARIKVNVPEVPSPVGAVVFGRAPGLVHENEAAWVIGEGAADADALLDDAYEPGAMTRGIYAAVQLALAVGRHGHDYARDPVASDRIARSPASGN